MTTQVPRAGETPQLPAAGSSTPGVALAGARFPGGPTLPDFDPMSLSRVVAQLANELFAAPIPAAGAPSPADGSALAAAPSGPSAPSAPLPPSSPASPAPTSANVPVASGVGDVDPRSPFDAPLDFSAITAPSDPFAGQGFDPALSLPLSLLDPRAPSPELPLPAPQGPPASPAVPTFDAFEISPTSDPSIRSLGNAPFDANVLKREFPILNEPVRGKRLVWLDNAATTQKPQTVIDRLSHFYEHENSNIHRAAHTLAARATDAYESARESVRRFLNAPSTREIVFVRGTTEGINLIAQSWGRRNVGPGDEIVISWLEHHANIVPWQMLCSEKGARLRVAPVDDRGQVILEEYEKLLGPKTKLVSFTQVSNALGTVNPLAEVIGMAKAHGVPVLVDGAQGAPHLGFDAPASGADFYAFSGHKLYGPTGIGVLWAKREHLEAMPPWQGGGDMIRSVGFDKTTFAPPPAKFEAGTPAIAQAIGLGAAVAWLQEIGVGAAIAHEREIVAYAEAALREVPGLRFVGTPRERSGAISFLLGDVHPHDVATIVDRHGVAVRAGHHCAQPVMKRYGIAATVRASFGVYSTREDVDALVGALLAAQEVFA